MESDRARQRDGEEGEERRQEKRREKALKKKNMIGGWMR